ncbi:MAG: zinc-ribbon domain-containing protein [Eubacteriaceae bacterium]|nr:zinc-ribbon domain-containing protein [Eubacteriaceae bacterium]
MKCSNCSKEILSDSEFCMYCGKKIAVSDDVRHVKLNNIIFTIVIIILIFCCILLDYKYTQAKHENDFFDKSAGIVIDDKTKYYHTYNCEVFQNTKKGYWIYNVEAAKDEGYKPCPKCH